MPLFDEYKDMSFHALVSLEQSMYDDEVSGEGNWFERDKLLREISNRERIPDMKIDQVAYYCKTTKAADFVKKMLGLTDEPWVLDTVTARSSVFGKPMATNVAELQFNYSLGIEVEILRYINGPNWHDVVQFSPEPFISHIGAHLEDGEEFPTFPGCRVAQETFTEKHTGEYLTTGAGAGRLFHYKVFELRRGNYFKVIKRIHPPGGYPK